MSDDPATRLAGLRGLAAERTGLGGASLSGLLRRMRRRLPWHLRRDASALARFEAMAAHPRLSRMVDPRALSRAERRLSRHLGRLDPARDRRNRRLDMLAGVGLALLAALAVALALVWARGLV